MTLTPERRQEIETMVEEHGDVLVFRNRRVTPSQLEPCSSIIRELLAEIDRLSDDLNVCRMIADVYRVPLEEPVRHPHE